jgi:hypothetical protein
MRRDGAFARYVEIVETASTRISEFGVDLDRELSAESRPGERLRLLRESTNRITRTANDAIDAYRRAKLILNRESMKPGAELVAVDELASRLFAARLELLDVLALAGTRYPSETDRGATLT